MIGERYGNDTGLIRKRYGNDTEMIRKRYGNDTETIRKRYGNDTENIPSDLLGRQRYCFIVYNFLRVDKSYFGDFPFR